MTKTTKTDAKPSPDEAIKKAVEKTPGGTTDGIAQVAGVARSTAGKALARLADAGKLSRHQGGRDRGKRLPDRWTLTGVGMPSAFAGHLSTEPPAEPAAKPGKATDAKPASESTSDGKPTTGDAKGDRLKPGQLEPLVLAYLKDNADSGPHGPTTVAKALERSSGAVGNCLVRLARAKKVLQVNDRPRRYRMAS